MRMLAFDTATPATTVALCGFQEQVLEARDDPVPGQRPGHATRLLPLAVELFERAGINWEDLEAIAVGIGPGTFTGLRIGIATARAVAQARAIPLTGISTLQSLAMNAQSLAEPAGVETVLAVIDARRGEVFFACWHPREVGHPDRELLGPGVLAPAALAELIESLDSPVLAIGNGAVEFKRVLERSGALVPEDDSELHRVTAINHCKLARTLRGAAPGRTSPQYLRLPDAEIARRAAGKS